MGRSLRAGQQLQWIQVTRKWLTRLKSPPDSTDYLTWRQQFLQKRLRLGLWLALFWHSIVSVEGLHSVLFEFERLKTIALNFYEDAAVADQWRGASLVYYLSVNVLLLLCLIGQKTNWGRRHPETLFLLFASSLNHLIVIVFTFFGLPETPNTLLFLLIATLVPVHWELHLFYQGISIAYYAIVYPITGLATLNYAAVYDLYAEEFIIELAWACSISILSVYLYERLKRSEFAAKRQLQIFLHSMSHDLQTPVVGSSIVLKSLLDKSIGKSADKSTDEFDDEIRVKRSTIERLLQGSNHQLALITSLLEAHTAETRGVVLHCQPTRLKPLVDSVLLNLNHSLTKKRIQLINHITDDLPVVNADADQLWRVFSNLIGNALKHNPHEIRLMLAANVVEPKQTRHGSVGESNGMENVKQLVQPLVQLQTPMLLCVLQDNGVGIAPEQCQHLFELYARGVKSRYTPGLGLGLYLCKQIIEAHGGNIGVISCLGEGSTFWFTLPLYPA